MHRIIVLERNTRAREVVASGQEVWIGRSREFAIALRDRWVSRRHAVIRLKGGELFMEDLGSTTGTIVNGRRLPPGETAQLSDGDVIVCGASTLLCRFDPEAGGGRPERSPSLERLVARANARLLVLARGAVRTWPVAGCSLILGRGEGCDIRVEEEGVAAEHARLLFTGDGFSIENLSPHRFILVNSRRTESAPLPSNSVVVLGLAQLLFVYEYEASGEPVRDAIEAIPARRFLSYLAQRAQLSPSQRRRLRRARAPSNLRLGEAAIRWGFITPAFWSSICSTAAGDCLQRRGSLRRWILSWFPSSLQESKLCDP
jgi:pSer/pThr/pTyr-binding forkhead associated (FHA) protein